MWYKQVLAQIGGGVNLEGEEKFDSKNPSEIDKIRDVDNEPAGLYDELSSILEKMGKTLDEYYSMNQVQQKEIWDLLVERPHRMTMDNTCLLYTSDAADEEDSVDLGGRRIIKKKKKNG